MVVIYSYINIRPLYIFSPRALRAPRASQLILHSNMRYYSKGSIIADSREEAKALMVITSGQAREAALACGCRR